MLIPPPPPEGGTSKFSDLLKMLLPFVVFPCLLD